MHKTVLALVALVALAGCSEAPAQGPETTQEHEDADTVTIRGVVVDESITPLAGANVTILELNRSTVTDAGGQFVFEDVPRGVYTLEVGADGYRTYTTTSDGAAGTTRIVLESTGVAPGNQTVRYEGRLQCAAEYLIIAGSCDRYLEPAGQQVLAQESIFAHDIDDGWQTIVVDVSFDSGAEQTYDGLRVSAKAPGDNDELSDYAKFGSFHGSQSFTFRIEPLGEYDNGDRPTPDSNATTIVFDVFAQGHGHGTVCTPPVVYDECFLGVGAGLDVEFELIVTTFYVEPAPEDFSLL